MRRRNRNTTLVLMGALFWAGGAWCGEVRFTSGPKAARAGNQVTITFAVSKPADVEVAVLNSQGEVVRHLAAGVLGGRKAPPAPLKVGLAQRIVWDGNDDLAKPAKGFRRKTFQVRVRAGLGAKFGRFIGGDPYTFGDVVGLAADEDGHVYVLGYNTLLNQRHITLRMFDPRGRYLREIIPFPADLQPQDMKDVARWDAERRTFRPRQIKNLNPEFYAGGRGWCLQLVSASKSNGVILTDGARIYTLEASGAVRGPQLVSRVLWAKKHIPWNHVPNSGRGPTYLAISPDGKYAYLAGPFTAKTRYGHKMLPFFPPGRVFRVKLDGPGFMDEFVTVPVAHEGGVGGNWTKGMGYEFSPRGPVHGLTVDAQGRLYVCDREHGRVAVYADSGKLASEVPIQYADQVAVHPKTGAVYVMQRDRKSYSEWHAELLKFDKLGKDAEPTARHKFDRKARYPRMALSVAKGRTLVWVAGVEGGLVALEDKGSSFVPVKTHFAPEPGIQRDWNRLAVDYRRDEVYVNDGASGIWRYDGKTGKGERLKKNGKGSPPRNNAAGGPKLFWATDLAVGYDGLLYVRSGLGRPPGQDYSGPLERYTRDLDPAPYQQTGTHVLSPYIYSRYGIGYAERGIGVGPDGKVYVSFMYRWVAYAIGGFGAHGRPLKGRYLKGTFPGKGKYPGDLDSAVIGPVPQANGGIRVDLAGNIYVGVLYWPKEAPLPHGYKMDRCWKDTVGSVVKFDPKAGGAMAGKDDAQRAEELTGVLSAYPGLAPFSKAGLGGNTCCVCRSPRFDLDRYGRLALPNAVTNSVWLYDNAGNLITEIGRYGNFDSQYVSPDAPGRRPLVAVPEIPLAWPTGAGFGPSSLYVNDTYSRRVVRADLTWQAEQTCPVK